MTADYKPKAVDLIAPPFSGHLYPLIALGKRLRQRGDRVRFITGIGKADLLQALGFEVQTVCAEDPYAMERIANTSYPVRGNPFLLYRQLRDNLKLFPTLRAELQTFFAERRPHVAVVDFCAPIAGNVCAALQIPWITTIPTPLALESPTGTPSYLGGWGQTRHWGHAVRNELGRWATRAIKKTLAAFLLRSFRAQGLALYRSDGSEAAYSPYAILGFGMNELEFPRQWPAAFHMVGPMVESPEVTPLVLSFPELKGRKAVLVTLGTHLLWAKRDLLQRLRPLFAAFPDIWFVVSLGDAKRQSDQPLERGEHWSLYSYVAYDSSLRRFEAVIHHGGAGILYSCIQYARPSLVCPCDYDQFDFAQRAQERAIGIRVPALTSAAAVVGLKALLNGYGREACDRMALDFCRYKPYETSLNEIDRWSMSKGRSFTMPQVSGGHH